MKKILCSCLLLFALLYTPFSRVRADYYGAGEIDDTTCVKNDETQCVDSVYSGHYHKLCELFESESTTNTDECTGRGASSNVTGGSCTISCEEPTPTPHSSTTSEASSNAGTPGSANPATCNSIYTDKPLLQHFIRTSATEIQLAWWKPVGGADKFSLIYGYSLSAMIYGIPAIPGNSTGITVGALRPNAYTYFQLWAWRGECVTKSDVIDP